MSRPRHVRLVTEPASDDDLLRRVQNAEPAAQTRLFRAHARHVASVLANLGVRSADLPDLVQEVFQTAFDRIACVTEGSKLRAWLTGIAVNKAREAARARRRKWWLRFFEPVEVPDVVGSDVPPEVRAAVRATDAALEQLPEDDRIAFVLRHVEGMSIDEVAASCEVSPATVKRRVTAARTRFMQLARDDARLSHWIEVEES